MMTMIKVLAAGSILGLPGCSSTCSFTDFACNVNADSAALSSPQAITAFGNLKAGGAAIICAVNSVAQISEQVAAQVNAGNAAIKDTQTVYTVSATICKALGGTQTGTVAVSS